MYLCYLVNSCSRFLLHGWSDFPCELMDTEKVLLRLLNVVQLPIAFSKKGRFLEPLCIWGRGIHTHICISLHVVFSLLKLCSWVCFQCVYLSYFIILLPDCKWHMSTDNIFGSSTHHNCPNLLSLLPKGTVSIQMAFIGRGE